MMLFSRLKNESISMADNNAVSFEYKGIPITLTLEDGEWYATCENTKFPVHTFWAVLPESVMLQVNAVEQEMYFDGR